MAHCSSCGYAGNYLRRPPPDLATPGEGGSTPFLPQLQSAPQGGAGAWGTHIHYILSSGLRGTLFRSRYSGAGERAKVGLADTGEGARDPFLLSV